MVALVLIVVLLHNALFADSARILVVIPFAVKSLYRVIGPIVERLLQNGHFVTLFSLQNFPEHANLTQILGEDLYNYAKLENSSSSSPYSMQILAYSSGFQVSRDVFTNDEFNRLLLSDAQFDAIISYDQPYCFSLAALEHRFKAQGISILNHGSTAQVAWIMGEHFNPAYQPEMKAALSKRMDFRERLYNIYITMMTLYLTYVWALPMHELLLDSLSERLPFLKNRPLLIDIIANKSLVLVSQHPIDDENNYSNRIKQIAGISIQHNETLPEVYDSFFADSNDGVIVISWGLLIRSQEVERCENTLLQALGKLRHRVIWRKTNTTLKEIPSNVLTAEWLPQQQILANKKVRLFMTHGGLNSITEAIHYGVPTIVTPFFMDQFYNAQKTAASGTGLILHASNFSEETVIWSINEVWNNIKYKEAAKKRSDIFQDRLINPLDEAIYWIEYVIRHGNLLKPIRATLSLHQILLLDVITFLIATVIIIYVIVLSIFLVCLKQITKKLKIYEEKKIK